MSVALIRKSICFVEVIGGIRAARALTSCALKEENQSLGRGPKQACSRRTARKLFETRAWPIKLRVGAFEGLSLWRRARDRLAIRDGMVAKPH